MTQKELLYVEDAIGHEKNIISICNESLGYLEDKSLCYFIRKEIKKHEIIKDKLMNLLESECND